jgi:thiamine-phosphate pyrophosphorylase
MKLIVISSPTPITNEHQIINSMFEEGLEALHIHKPNLTKEEIKKFIQGVDSKYHNRIAMHADFQKFHSLEELKQYYIAGRGQMAFLSPVFDSISKQGYKSNFSDRLNKFIQFKPELMAAIKGKKIIALGGIDEDKIEMVRKVGFAGAAVLGAIWNNKNPLDKFLKIQNISNSKTFLRRELFLEESKSTTAKKQHE